MTSFDVGGETAATVKATAGLSHSIGPEWRVFLFRRGYCSANIGT
jgi:hypothetical protein